MLVALYHWSTEKGWLVTYLMGCNMCKPCLCVYAHHWRRLMGTKWQHSQSCFSDFQRLILNRMRTQLLYVSSFFSAFLIFFIPLLWKGPQGCFKGDPDTNKFWGHSPEDQYLLYFFFLTPTKVHVADKQLILKPWSWNFGITVQKASILIIKKIYKKI